jgi:hypothetical protein
VGLQKRRQDRRRPGLRAHACAVKAIIEKAWGDIKDASGKTVAYK